MNILIPMAGGGTRFKQAGYTFPKALIDVIGKPMVSWVVDNFPFEDARFIFLAQREEVDKYKMHNMFARMVGNRDHEVVLVDGLTEGAACTALLASDLIKNEDELIIANSDQYMEYCTFNFNTLRLYTNVDGIIFTFPNAHPKWSYVKCNDNNQIIEVAEKIPISCTATCGVYYYRKGSDFVDAAHSMIAKNIRTNGEFYIAPAYNEMIQNSKLIIPFFVDRMHGMGTPEDLEQFVVNWRY